MHPVNDPAAGPVPKHIGIIKKILSLVKKLEMSIKERPCPGVSDGQRSFFECKVFVLSFVYSHIFCQLCN